MSDLAVERNELLIQIEEHLDSDELGTISQGGGGSGGIVGGGGLLSKIAGGATGTGGAVLAALGIGGGAIGGSRYAMGQGMLGQEGKNTLDRRTQFEGFSGMKNAMGNPGEFIANGFINALDPTGIGETMARKAGNRLMEQTTFDEEVKQGFQLGVEVWREELNSFEWPEPPDFDVPDSIDFDTPQFLQDAQAQSQDKGQFFGGRFKGGFQNPATGQREDLGTGPKFTVDNTFNFNLDNLEQDLRELQDNAVSEALDEFRNELDRRLSQLTGGIP
jgi:hypothetical protein